MRKLKLRLKGTPRTTLFRRREIAIFKSLLGSLIIIFLSSCGSKLEEIKPNIVLINVDDLGWKDVGFMGSKFYETPNIDYLATLGMVFVNGYASASNCAPSRATLMTGKWSVRHGIYSVGSSERGDAKYRKLIPTKNTQILNPNFRTLPEILKENDYNTCHAGKWHLSDNPVSYGFDLNIGGGHNGHPKSYLPPYKNVSIEAGNNRHLTDLIVEKTLDFLDTVQGPFFLNYAPYAVHTPIQPIESLLPKYKNKEEINGQGNVEYATMIENLDRNLGLLVNKLKTKNHFENSLIVFTSDNGGLYGITKQLPLRAGKGSYYEGGIRVPWIFIAPGKIKKTTSSDLAISNIDVLPTILEFAGIEAGNLEMDGISLLPFLKQEQSEIERTLFWHFPIYLQAYKKDHNENRDTLFRTRPGSVIRKGDWKLHYYFEDEGIELYNLRMDEGERKNLAEVEREKAEELLVDLKGWWKKTNAPIPSIQNPAYSAPSIEKTELSISP